MDRAAFRARTAPLTLAQPDGLRRIALLAMARHAEALVPCSTCGLASAPGLHRAVVRQGRIEVRCTACTAAGSAPVEPVSAAWLPAKPSATGATPAPSSPKTPHLVLVATCAAALFHLLPIGASERPSVAATVPGLRADPASRALAATKHGLLVLRTVAEDALVPKRVPSLAELSPERAEHVRQRLLFASVLTPGSAVLAEASVLSDWVHPIPGSVRDMPSTGTRRFGAPRPGDRNPECGEGHCGVDLSGPVGTPILSIRDGVVERCQHDDVGAGGRYVRVVHENGVRSYYMHLDRIAAGLAVGQKVEGGTVVGTLGTSGIKHSEPHMHFQFSVENRWGNPFYIDPEPMLRTAKVLPMSHARAQIPSKEERAERRRRVL